MLICINVNVFIFASVYVYVYVSVCVCKCMYMYVCGYVCVSVSMYLCIYRYTRKNRCLAVAKIVNFSVRSLLLVQAKRVLFSILKFKKVHVDLRPPMNLSTSILRGRGSVLWPCKKIVLHFRWQARDSLHSFARFGCSFFCFC